MRITQVWLFKGTSFAIKQGEAAIASDSTKIIKSNVTAVFNATNGTIPAGKNATWDVDTSRAHTKLNPGRLRDQMFAYTVTQQVVNTFMEIGLPYVLRAVNKIMKGKATAAPAQGNSSATSTPNGKSGAKKRVIFEDEQEKGGLKEREFLESVRNEVALTDYDLFFDYNEMVTQFGYVVVWSTIWPLASGKISLSTGPSCTAC
jgi:anoctamin-10